MLTTKKKQSIFQLCHRFFNFSQGKLNLNRILKMKEQVCDQYKEKVFTFHKQVLACVINPNLIGKSSISLDASKRAQTYLNDIVSAGSYTNPIGILSVRKTIAKRMRVQNNIDSITADDILLIEGITQSIHMIFKSLITSSDDSVLVPVPSYNMFSETLKLLNGHRLEYYLDKEKGWDVDMQKLQSTVQHAKKQGKIIKAIVIVNPSNPTSSIISQYRLAEIIKFAVKHKIVIISDEIHKDFIYSKDEKFVSVFETMVKMGQRYQDQCQLISLYSLSKTPFGQCGVKCGYIHCHNIRSQVIEQFIKIRNLHSSNSVGQLLLDLVHDPPIKNVSQQTMNLFKSQTQLLQQYMNQRAQKFNQALKKMSNIKFSPILSARYVYGKLQVKEGTKIQLGTQKINQIYAEEALSELGMILYPASQFSHQSEFHFRMNLLNFNSDELNAKLQQFGLFNDKFYKKYNLI